MNYVNKRALTIIDVTVAEAERMTSAAIHVLSSCLTLTRGLLDEARPSSRRLTEILESLEGRQDILRGLCQAANKVLCIAVAELDAMRLALETKQTVVHLGGVLTTQADLNDAQATLGRMQDSLSEMEAQMSRLVAAVARRQRVSSGDSRVGVVVPTARS